jgi:hypothetical protein
MTEISQFPSPISTSVQGGSFRVGTEATTVIAAAATPVLAAGTTVATGASNNVTVSATNRLTADWTGAGTRITQVTVTARVDMAAAGGPKDVALHVYENGVALGAPLFREITLHPSDPPSEFHMAGTIDMADTDYVELWLENVTDDADVILLEGSTLTIKS